MDFQKTDKIASTTNLPVNPAIESLLGASPFPISGLHVSIRREKPVPVPVFSLNRKWLKTLLPALSASVILTLLPSHKIQVGRYGIGSIWRDV